MRREEIREIMFREKKRNQICFVDFSTDEHENSAMGDAARDNLIH